jgi:heme exporter protein D
MGHWAYITAAYLVTGIVVAGLVAWAIRDWRSQRRALAALEARATTRGPLRRS